MRSYSLTLPLTHLAPSNPIRLARSTGSYTLLAPAFVPALVQVQSDPAFFLPSPANRPRVPEGSSKRLRVDCEYAQRMKTMANIMSTRE